MENAVKIQEGLLMTSYFLNGKIVRKLYAEEGYRFYDKSVEFYDEDGNIDTTQKSYMVFMVIPEIKDIDDIIVEKI